MTEWHNGKWAAVLGRSWKGEMRREKKSKLAVEIRFKELREYKKEFLIFRI
jgi:hypothetical protein